MTVDNLPLLDLFTRLREAGLPLGITEYRSLLHALEAGFGISGLDALERLCRILWVKSTDEERVFKYYFDQVLAPVAHLRGEPFAALEPEAPAAPPTEPPAPEADAPLAKLSAADDTPAIPDLPASASELLLTVEEEILVARAVSQPAHRDDERQYKRFTSTDEYFPVSRREMKQSWRYLRCLVREGAPVELDIDATIDNIGRQGVLLEPVLIPRRVNRTQLLLLIDQEGSMVPFHALSRRLEETAVRGGRLSSASVYSFHDCPTEHLFQEILVQLCNKRMVVLIFSDAGAARGDFSPERLELTHAFLERLRQTACYVAWLNPMPISRWHDTTAGEIARIVPMFEISRRGLDGAIGVLRGHSTHLQG